MNKIYWEAKNNGKATSDFVTTDYERRTVQRLLISCTT